MVNIDTRLRRKFEYTGKWYELLFGLQGTEAFEAYEDLFPNPEFDPESHYAILKDEINRILMVALYKTRTPSIEDLTKATGLEQNDISGRLDFFRTNGMKQVEIRKVA